MSRPPSRRPGRDVLGAAEAAFKAATTKPVEAPPKTVPLPHAKEQVTLRLDQDVLEHFRGDGPGWQERLNAALRKGAGL